MSIFLGCHQRIINLISNMIALLFFISCTNIEPPSQDKSSLTFFTPDQDVNRALRSGELNPDEVFGISTTDEGLNIKTPLPETWTWAAVRDYEYQNQSISFFFMDGWLFTNESVKTPFRLKKSRRDVSDLIHSNVYTIAFYTEKGIEKEVVIFIASEHAIEAELVIDEKLWGEEKRINYSLQAGEGHFISVMKMADEFQPQFFENDQIIRQTMNLNSGWKFIRGDYPQAYTQNYKTDDWDDILIPHSWNTRDVFDQRSINDGYDIYHGYYRGAGWYRKEFILDKSLNDQRIILEFEGANQITDVWINGKYSGQHIGGYTGFNFEVTEQLNYGVQKNMIAVRVDNSYNYDVPPHTADFVFYGGLYRDVNLSISPHLFLEKPVITFPVINEESVTVAVKIDAVNNTSKPASVLIINNVVNARGEIVVSAQSEQLIDGGNSFQFEQTMPDINYPKLWSPDQPYLYSIYSTIYVDGKPVDIIETPIGLRWYNFDAEKGFFLNGKSLKLKGVNKHQDYLGLGNGVPDSLMVRDIEIIKKMGANFIRLAHYPHDPSVLEACARLGLLVWSEIPLVNSIGGEEFNANTKQMMREMIQRDINNPAIILWGLTNESVLRFANQEQIPKILNLLQELSDIAKQEDPSRLTVQAHNHIVDYQLVDKTDVIGRNRYFGWYEGDFEDFDKALDAEHTEHPEWKMIISEYGVGSKLGYHVENPIMFDFSEEYQLDFHEHYWKAINERPWVAGGAVWNMFDFGSFVKLGNIPRINQKGLCDMSREPKDVYYFYQSQWTDKLMVYIVSHTREQYFGTATEAKNIRVYSNGDKVELFLNGNSIGSKNDQYVYRWEIDLILGQNNLRAVAYKDAQVIEDQIDLGYFLND